MCTKSIFLEALDENIYSLRKLDDIDNRGAGRIVNLSDTKTINQNQVVVDDNKDFA